MISMVNIIAYFIYIYTQKGVKGVILVTKLVWANLLYGVRKKLSLNAQETES